MTLAKINPLFMEFGLAKDRLNRFFGKDDLWDAEGALTAADWTPAVDILEGRMNVEIGMAAVRPAEFIILKFSHKMQES